MASSVQGLQSKQREHAGFSVRRRIRRYILFAFLIAPAFILRLATAGYPIAKTIQLSLREYKYYGTVERYVGLENFKYLPDDFGFSGAIEFTVMFVILSTIFQLILGLLAAQLLNAKFLGRGIVRAINLIPWAIPTIVAAYTFRWILHDQFGMITHWIYLVTGDRPVIFIDPQYARAAVIATNVWKNAPFMTIIFLAGMQGIPEELYDASKVDGANPLQRFFYITLPLMTPLIVTMGTFFIIWQVASLDLIYGMTRGGPGVATDVLALLIFDEGVRSFNYGFASAISVILLGFVGVIGMVGIFLFRRFEVKY
jgi:multiple sugar transport system permease protein